jgi:dihydrofolate reductase
VAKLHYAAITSVDGYIEDTNGNIDWGVPDEQVNAFINDFERTIGTYLYGRRLYESMRVWETWDGPGQPLMKEFAEIWRAADKVVYSRTLQEVSSAKTHIERDFNADSIRQQKSSSLCDLTIGGAELASEALKAGLVDELHLFVCPMSVGSGKSALPRDLPLQLRLMDQHAFDSGVVHLHYATVL